MKKEDEGMEVCCKRCDKCWIYKGKKGKSEWPEYIRCPNCSTSVKLNNGHKGRQDGK